MELIQKIIISYLLLHLTYIFHEFGHVLFYKIFYKTDEYEVIIGFGNKSVRIGKVLFYFFPIFGRVLLKKIKNHNKKNALVFLAGPLTNLVMIILIIFLNRHFVQNQITINSILKYGMNFFLISNITQFIGTIIPVKYSGIYSNVLNDGKCFWENIKS